MIRVGLTGGAGCGKSAALEILRSLNAPVISADEVAHRLTQAGGDCLDRIRALAGDGVFSQTGQLRRQALRRRVFSEPALKKQLETLLHPQIRRQLEDWTRRQDAPYCVLEAPLLIESGMSSLADRIALVCCPRELQVQRLLKRDGGGRDEAERIVRSQLPQSAKLELTANFRRDLIHNDKDRAHLERQVLKLHRKWTGEASH